MMMDRFLVHYLIAMMWLLALACSEEGNQKNTTQREFPDQQGWNSTLIISQEGKTSAIIKYGHMEKFSKRKMVYFDAGVELELFKDDGTLKTHLTSDKAELNEATNDMVAIGNVVVVDSGRTLKTERLDYITKAKKIISELPVMMWTAEGDTLYGDGFEMEQSSDEINILNPSGKLSKGFDIKSAERNFSKRKQSGDSAFSATDSLTMSDSSKTFDL